MASPIDTFERACAIFKIRAIRKIRFNPWFLIIDDDLAVRVSLQLLLKQAGYATRAVAGPAEALAAVQAAAPQLVLLDMNFAATTTGADGLALLAELKELAPLVPVVLITGWGSIALAVAGMKAGAAEFVTKPWQNETLLQTISTVLQLRAPAEAAPPPGRRALDRQFALGSIVGEDARLLAVLQPGGPGGRYRRLGADRRRKRVLAKS